MAFVLRDYQKQAADAAVRFFKSEKKHNALMVLPTGAGKSLVLAEIANQLGEDILLFGPSREITSQNYDKILSYDVLDVAIFSASFGSKKISRITLATIGSAINAVERFKHFKYILIDECHLVNSKSGQYASFLSQINAKVIGLTATPFRLAVNSFGSELRFLTRTNPKIFSELIYYVQIEDLAKQGFYAPLTYYSIKGFEPGKLRVNSTGQGYTDESIKAYYKEIAFGNKLIKVIERLLQIRKNILIFTQFIEEAQAVVNMYPDISAIVTGQTPKKERDAILKKFKAGELKFVTNVGTLTTGFDFPQLETVVFARPTRALNLWYQCLGRAVRPHPDKKEAWVADMCGTYELYGEVENLRIDKDFKGRWIITSKGKQLTNTYFGPSVDQGALANFNSSNR